jgi:phenylacetate-CoA ligase
MYLNALKYHKTQWITGYSNSIYQLAQLAMNANLDIPNLKAVLTTSEKLTPEMRDVIERAFSTHVFEEYGTVEDPFYVCENEFGQKLINPDAGILEIVDDQDRPLPPGEQGHVLATSFIRGSQPFIRYRLGDIAILSDEPARCGRHMPVLKEVVGRIEDTVYGPDGRRMVRFHGIFINQPHIKEGQIVQESLDHIRVRIVPKPGFGISDEQDVISRIQQRLSERMNITVELADHIELTKAGKFRAVVSKLSPEERQAAINR